MSNQRGVIADGWLYLIGLIVFIVVCTVAFKAWTSYIGSVDQQGYDRGKAEALKSVGDRDRKELQDAIRDKNQAQLKLDTALKENQDAQKVSDAAYRKGKQDGKAQSDRDNAAIQSGALVLRSHQGQATGSGSGLRDAVGNTNQVAGCRSGSDGDGDNRLSPDDSKFLLWVGSEADRLKKKVNALIDIVKGDRVQINGAWNDDGHPVLQMVYSLR